MVASYTNMLHTEGTFEGFSRLLSPKWLRAHNSMEWPDYYATENVEYLRLFFDFYLKKVENGWEETPIAQLSVLNPGGEDVLNVTSEEWRPAGSAAQRFFPQAYGSLTSQESQSTSSVEYTLNNTGGTGSVEFSYTVPDNIDSIGYIRVKIWVETIGSDDMDLSVSISRRSANGSIYTITIVLH